MLLLASTTGTANEVFGWIAYMFVFVAAFVFFNWLLRQLVSCFVHSIGKVQ